MTDFPLTKQLGLSVEVVWQDTPDPHSTAPRKIYFVRAADLEALLSKAVNVFSDDGRFWGEKPNEPPGPDDTHTALLLNVQPIVRDTADSFEILLENILDVGQKTKWGKDFPMPWSAWLDRARKLLEAKNG